MTEQQTSYILLQVIDTNAIQYLRANFNNPDLLKNNGMFRLDLMQSFSTGQNVDFTSYPVLDGKTRHDNVSIQPRDFSIKTVVSEVTAGTSLDNQYIIRGMNNKTTLATVIEILSYLQVNGIFLNVITSDTTYKNFSITSVSQSNDKLGSANVDLSFKENLMFDTDLVAEDLTVTEDATDTLQTTLTADEVSELEANIETLYRANIVPELPASTSTKADCAAVFSAITLSMKELLLSLQAKKLCFVFHNDNFSDSELVTNLHLRGLKIDSATLSAQGWVQTSFLDKKEQRTLEDVATNTISRINGQFGINIIIPKYSNVATEYDTGIADRAKFTYKELQATGQRFSESTAATRSKWCCKFSADNNGTTAGTKFTESIYPSDLFRCDTSTEDYLLENIHCLHTAWLDGLLQRNYFSAFMQRISFIRYDKKSNWIFAKNFFATAESNIGYLYNTSYIATHKQGDTVNWLIWSFIWIHPAYISTLKYLLTKHWLKQLNKYSWK